MAYKEEMMVNLKATELRLGLPGTHEADYNDEQDQSSSTVNTTPNAKKRQLDHHHQESSSMNKLSDHILQSEQDEGIAPPPTKAQIVGWPPVRSYRKNSMMMSQQKKSGNTSSEAENICGTFVKVSMDGAPYLRKIDLRVYSNYPELLKALEGMFKFTIGAYSEREGYKGSDFVPTYEDKDGDWMLVGDVPWNMFMSSCKRMRVMKESEARGLGCGV